MNIKKIIAIAGASAAALALAPVADAAKGGNGNGNKGSGDSLMVLVADGVYGGTTDAAVVSTSDLSRLASETTGTEYWVRAQCSQYGVVVYEQSVKTSGGVATFTLGPTAMWTGGSADCTADTGYLRGGKWVSTSSSAFHTAAG